MYFIPSSLTVFEISVGIDDEEFAAKSGVLFRIVANPYL